LLLQTFPREDNKKTWEIAIIAPTISKSMCYDSKVLESLVNESCRLLFSDLDQPTVIFGENKK
jgi:hypothetical protein